MHDEAERRKEHRLRYHWPVWFAEDFDELLSQGQMVDVSSDGAAFTCYADQSCPYPGQNITARFSVPRFETDDSFGMASFTRNGHVIRVDQLNDHVRRVAVQWRIQKSRTALSGLDSVRPSLTMGWAKQVGLKSRPRLRAFDQSVQRLKCLGSSSSRSTRLRPVSAYMAWMLKRRVPGMRLAAASKSARISSPVRAAPG